MAQAWYVARTNPSAEYLAQNQLEINGLEHYLPLVSTSSPRQGRADSPLFPSYIFLRYDPESPKSIPLRTIPGISGLVHFGEVSPVVPDDVIIRLRQTVSNINERGGLSPNFKPGDQVWIQWGPQDSQDIAVVVSDRKSPHGRVQVLIEFLGQLIDGEVSRLSIRPVDKDDLGDARWGRNRRRTRGKGRYISNVDPRAAHNGLPTS